MSHTFLIDTNTGRREMRVGDTVWGSAVSLIGTHFFELNGARHYTSGEAVTRCWFGGEAVTVVRNGLFANFFDRQSGQLLLPDDVTSTGWLVVAIYNEAIVLDPPNSNTEPAVPEERRILFWESSKSMVECGVEARRSATPEELCGLPRTPEGLVPLANGGQADIQHAVWYENGYRLISDLRTDGSAIGRFIAPDRPNYSLTDTGVMCPTADMQTLADGRTASPFEVVLGRNADVLLAREAVRVQRDYYSGYWAEEAPEGYVPYIRHGALAYWPASMLVTLADTGEQALREDAVSWEESFYSRQWADENLHVCEECGTYHVRSDGPYCERCKRDSRTRIRGYSNRASAMMPPEKDVPIKFGIELEVGCDRGVCRSTCVGYVADAFDRVTDSMKYVTYKEDGSISEVDGFEIVTRPDCPSVHKKLWTEVLSDRRVLDSITSWRSGKCGMHIHVSREPLSELWIGRMMVLVNADAFSGLLRSVAGRGSNSYSVLRTKKFTDVKRSNNRYEALNVGDSRTIEFRMFRGTTLLSSFLKNIEFVEAVIDYCRPHARSLQCIGDPQDFLSYVSSHRKQFENLFGFLKQKGWYDS